MTWTDEELVARSISGDANSFNELILRWERPIYALAYRTIGREEDARDVCQETFLRAFRALPGFRGQAKFSSWLYRIALNLCRDWIRRGRRRPVGEPPGGVELMELPAPRRPGGWNGTRGHASDRAEVRALRSAVQSAISGQQSAMVASRSRVGAGRRGAIVPRRVGRHRESRRALRPRRPQRAHGLDAGAARRRRGEDGAGAVGWLDREGVADQRRGGPAVARGSRRARAPAENRVPRRAGRCRADDRVGAVHAPGRHRDRAAGARGHRGKREA